MLRKVLFWKEQKPEFDLQDSHRTARAVLTLVMSALGGRQGGSQGPLTGGSQGPLTSQLSKLQASEKSCVRKKKK